MPSSSPPERERRRRPRVLVVDDQLSMAEMIADGLAERDYDAMPVSSSPQAAKQLESEPFDAVVTDLRMPELDGLGILSVARRIAPDCPVIVMTAYSAVETAVESIRQGAYHYLTKPFKVDELALFLERALEESKLRRETVSLKRSLRAHYAATAILGQSPAIQELIELVQRLGDADVPILIGGETGTGKGLVARMIHAEGRRASGPFVTVNCAALPEQLLESELFGHVRGAFTGATANRLGLFAEADGGTLFLDEIAEMSPALQAKLLHVLETGAVRPVGANKERRVDTRVLAASHRDLRARAASGEFRDDLLYRLDVVSVELPPLRHRTQDIPILVDHFLARARAKHGGSSRVHRISSEAMERMMAYPWPGNVRELEHTVERLVLLCQRAEAEVGDLPPAIANAPRAAEGMSFGSDVIPMRDAVRRYVVWAYKQLGERRLVTADKLGIDAKTLARILAADEAEGRSEGSERGE